jgi:hypothetical protein
MFDPELFEAEVSQHFEFLILDHGFQRDEVKVSGPECWVSFSKPDVRITISQEAGSACHVALFDRRAAGPDDRREFGLHELLQEAERRGVKRRMPRANASLHQEIAGLAEDLRSFGQDVLSGNFTELQKRHQRHVVAVKRRAPVG